MTMKTIKFMFEKSVPTATRDVNFTSIAEVMHKREGMNRALKFIVDTEDCLDRLYGGFLTDWTSGGQWIRVYCFIQSLIQHLNKCNVELVFCFNGSLEKHFEHKWVEQIRRQRMKLDQFFGASSHNPMAFHDVSKWNAPAYLQSALMLMMRKLKVPVFVTTTDHRQELINYYYKNAFDGILADNPIYFAFNPPSLYSAKSLKLTFKGSLKTKQYFVSEVLKTLNISPEKFCILMALLGDYNIPFKELAPIYKAAGVSSLVKEDEVVKTLVKYLNGLELSVNGKKVAMELLPTQKNVKIREDLAILIQYYFDGTQEGFVKKFGDHQTLEDPKPRHIFKMEEGVDTTKLASEVDAVPSDIATVSTKMKDHNDEEALRIDHFLGVLGEKAKLSDEEIMKESESATSPSPLVDPDVLNFAKERHQCGFISPYIYQLLAQREIKLPLLLETYPKWAGDLPNIHEFYEPLRRNIYAILYDLRDESGSRSARVKEWKYCVVKKTYQSSLVVPNAPMCNSPPMRKLWFGTTVNDRRARLKTFTTVMKSESPLMINVHFVQPAKIIAAMVLRYIMCSENPILRSLELDAFIVTFLCPDLNSPEYSQNLQMPKITFRGIQLATMFMHGVELAKLACEASGMPIPWTMFCPWLFFDGKIFQYYLARAHSSRNLRELCGIHSELVFKAERMRTAILEGLEYKFASHPSVANFSPRNPVAPAGMPLQTPAVHPYHPVPARFTYPAAGGVAGNGKARAILGRGNLYGVDRPYSTGNWSPLAGNRNNAAMRTPFWNSRNSKSKGDRQW